jgi:TPR repeat protein
MPNKYMYGRLLGRGASPDLHRARAWFERAAGAAVPDAQVAVAEMLVNGRRSVLAPRGTPPCSAPTANMAPL